MAKNPRLVDITGQQFGDWTVLHQAGNTPRGAALWACRCSCGSQRSVLGADLRGGKSGSCGHWKVARLVSQSKRHGQSNTRLYNIWQAMKSRCLNPAAKAYERYGAMGITVCEEWKTFQPFFSWATSRGYSDDLSIDRIDNSRGYSPDNCRWADRKTQARNRSIVAMREDGTSWAEYAEAHGISSSIFNNRVAAGGWDKETAATWPLGKRRAVRPRTESGRWQTAPPLWRR